MNLNIFAESAHTTSNCYATKVNERSPLLRWELLDQEDAAPAPNFSGFDVRIYDQNHDLVEGGSNLARSEFQVTETLKSGPYYFWTFRARLKQNGLERVTPWSHCGFARGGRDFSISDMYPFKVTQEAK